MVECRDALELPWPERLDRVDEIRVEAREDALTNKLILTGIFVSSFLKAYGKEVQDCARQTMVFTAIALEHYRLANDRYPSSLSELTPKYLPLVPTDPFDGEELRYRTRGGGYALYSVGADRVDDFGQKPIPRNSVQEVPRGDIIFAIEP